MEMCSIIVTKAKLAWRDIEHLSESKMTAATILDVWKCPIVDPGDIQGHAIPILGVLDDGESISGDVVLYGVTFKVKPKVRLRNFNV